MRADVGALCGTEGQQRPRVGGQGAPASAGQLPARGKAGKGACETPVALEFLDDIEKLCKLAFGELLFDLLQVLHGVLHRLPVGHGYERKIWPRAACAHTLTQTHAPKIRGPPAQAEKQHEPSGGHG
jgi:hypothetical protein